MNFFPNFNIAKVRVQSLPKSSIKLRGIAGGENWAYGDDERGGDRGTAGRATGEGSWAEKRVGCQGDSLDGDEEDGEEEAHPMDFRVRLW